MRSGPRRPQPALLSHALSALNGLDPALRPLRPLRTAARRILLRLYPPAGLGHLTGVEAPLAGGLRMRLDPRSLIEWEVLFTGYEPEVRELLRRALRTGDAAVDVGANAGAHTLVMAAACRPGPVLACEPNPDLFARLQANVALNRLENVRCFNLALAAAPGEVELHVPADPVHTGGASLLAGVHEHLQGARIVRVPALTVDRLVEREGVGRVAVLKIDVEGAEAAVLKGAARVLERDRPALAFEYTAAWWEAAGAGLAEVLDGLAQLGYAPHAVTWRGLRSLPAAAPERLNLWLSPRG